MQDSSSGRKQQGLERFSLLCYWLPIHIYLVISFCSPFLKTGISEKSVPPQLQLAVLQRSLVHVGSGKQLRRLQNRLSFVPESDRNRNSNINIVIRAPGVSRCSKTAVSASGAPSLYHMGASQHHCGWEMEKYRRKNGWSEFLFSRVFSPRHFPLCN